MGHRAVTHDRPHPRGMVRRPARWAMLAVVLGALVTLQASATAAAYEVSPTTQAWAARAAWLPYASPPPGGARTVCLVDTGVDLNADLDSARVSRSSLDGGPPGDLDPHQHGTRMAMFAAAILGNDSGMVGAWPGVSLLSVRAAASPPGEHATFEFANYTHGIRRCLADLNVVAINLSLGGSAPTSADETTAFVDVVEKAHARGVNVVAAVGNDGGAVQTPARLPGVLGVGGGDGDGALCALSARGEGLDLVAPGCGLDSAEPLTLTPLVDAAGTSASAVLATTAGLAALRSYAPHLSWAQAEEILRTRRPGGVLDVEAAFRAAGLEAVVDDALTRTSPPDPQAPPATSPAGTTDPDRPGGWHPGRWQPRRFGAPRLRSASCRAGVVRVRLARRPTEAMTVVEARLGGRVLARVRRPTSALVLRLGRCDERLRVHVRFLDRYGDPQRRSRSTVRRVRI